ncbi:IgA Peptidase M64 [Porphyromonas macacae]|uniref:IgA Peptidase M64 n=1 Tax=Porphyromonas macacae TaxID=28115 RepID=A0A379E7N3_9PORP|nr:M64 family metallopeptidase [Porphyromonas macacae]SUB88718.1 IgA Peptidase M64 [Porphyromonas macacae]
MKLKRILFLIVSLFPLLSWAQQKEIDFNTFFADSTLRVDYIFAGGNSKQVSVYVDELNRTEGWYGRRHHLDSLALAGMGSIVMQDEATGRIIYKTSFSSLFQEWLSTDEATKTAKSFENVFLLPYPKKSVIITVSLRDMTMAEIAVYKHRVDPADILIHHKKATRAPQVEQLLYSGNPKEKIDVVVMSEGYTAAEKETFLTDARITKEALLSHEPFASMADRFNIIAVFTPSAQSGVSVPRMKNWKETAFGSHFDTFYSDRYLTSRRLKAIHDALTGVAYEHIIMLANTDVYGGGGIFNSFTLTTAHHAGFRPVVVHEFGHSFGGLADEYFYDNDVMTDVYMRNKEPWEQNVTTLIDFDGKKWSELIKKDTPRPTPVKDSAKYEAGLYEGAAYSSKGFYRCSYDCRMRTNEAPAFCPACQLALKRLIEFYTR